VKLLWRFEAAPFESGKAPALRVSLFDQFGESPGASENWDTWHMQLAVYEESGDVQRLGASGSKIVKEPGENAPGAAELPECVAEWFEEAFIRKQDKADEFLRDKLKDNAPIGRGGILSRNAVPNVLWPFPDQMVGVLWLKWDIAERLDLSVFRMECERRPPSTAGTVKLTCQAIGEPLPGPEGDPPKGLLLRHTHWGTSSLSKLPQLWARFQEIQPEGKVYYLKEAEDDLTN
jgi:hypothetical protein